MRIQDRSMSACDAAKHFAENNWEESRKVRRSYTDKECNLRFQLVGGVAWYTVRKLQDYSGWEVTRD